MLGERETRLRRNVLVPEPSTLAMLLGAGLATLAVWRKRG
jgi:hypothetical protein